LDALTPSILRSCVAFAQLDHILARLQRGREGKSIPPKTIGTVPKTSTHGPQKEDRMNVKTKIEKLKKWLGHTLEAFYESYTSLYRFLKNKTCFTE
jgi:hypothetical protein